MKGGGVVASIALLAIAAVLAITGGDGGDDGFAIEPIPPQIVAAEDLADSEQAAGHEIYWAGAREGTRLELSVEPDGSVFLRYLPPGTPAGDSDPAFLTVGTYPVADAQAALRQAARESGGTLGRVEDGGMTLENSSSEGSVYLAYPRSDLQIEVYDPRPGRALALIRSGAIVPVGE
jgi:hypothetical protein